MPRQVLLLPGEGFVGAIRFQLVSIEPQVALALCVDAMRVESSDPAGKNCIITVLLQSTKRDAQTLCVSDKWRVLVYCGKTLSKTIS